VADVAERGAPKRIVERTEAELGPVDVLCNNAAISRSFVPVVGCGVWLGGLLIMG